MVAAEYVLTCVPSRFMLSVSFIVCESNSLSTGDRSQLKLYNFIWHIGCREWLSLNQNIITRSIQEISTILYILGGRILDYTKVFTRVICNTSSAFIKPLLSVQRRGLRWLSEWSYPVYHLPADACKGWPPQSWTSRGCLADWERRDQKSRRMHPRWTEGGQGKCEGCIHNETIRR